MNEKNTNVQKNTENENYVIYDATFIDKTWKVGTKNDPKKEFGMIKFNVEMKLAQPKEDGTDSYIQTIDEFIFDKANFPEQHIDRYTPIKVAYLPPVSPQGKMRFVKVVI